MSAEAKHSVPDSHAHTAGTSLSEKPVDLSQTAEALLFLRIRPLDSDTPSLEEQAQKLAAKKPNDRTYLENATLEALYGTLKEDLEAVTTFATQHGLTVKKPASAASRTATLTGPLEKMAAAFDVSFVHRTDDEGREFQSYDGILSVPAELKSVVEGIVGLDHRPLTKHKAKTIRGPSERHPAKSTGYLPTEVAKAYKYPPGHDGTGQCIGIVEVMGGYDQAELDKYFKEVVGLNPAPAPVINVPEDGNQKSESLVANYEVVQDIEVASAMAPGAQVVVYFANLQNPLFKLWLDMLAEAIFDDVNKPSVLSISWELPESVFEGQSPKVKEAFDHLFLVAACKGITICTISGDSGALTFEAPAGGVNGAFGSPPEVNFPASSPYTLACGGTALHADGDAIQSEVVWNCYAELMTMVATGPDGKPTQFLTNGGASTGGVSSLYELPSYQGPADVPERFSVTWKDGCLEDQKRSPGRGVPDVAANADFNTGYAILFNGAPGMGGGTSTAAPAWAALIARLNQALGFRVGFINPHLYALQLDTDAQVLNTVVEGNNGGYEARPGRLWNACTGLGSPNGTALLEALQKLMG